MDETFAARLARAAVAFFHERTEGQLRRAVVGRDTRASGESLSTAVIAALVESGLEVYDAGIAPTPAIAGAVARLEAQMGIMITASHNPARDNGIKFFGENGGKLTDSDEIAIEERLAEEARPVLGDGVMRRADIIDGYIEEMEKMLPRQSLAGWRMVVDAANGATVVTTPAVLQGLGAQLVLLGHKPNGANINDGVGSLYPQKMAEAVRISGARVGLAHDGDGDRLVLADETGSLLDGDDILAILGVHCLRRGCLKQNTLVATIQSNLGLDEAIKREGGRVVRTPVGDRYVIEEMLRGGYNVGGEASGHLVLLDHSPTGDGLAGLLKVLEIMRATGQPLSELRRCWRKFPQAGADIVVREKVPLDQLTLLPRAISDAEAALGERGRVLVRYSGTEPKLRLLVEGENEEEASRWLLSLRGTAILELAPVGG
jgi:phosphoglucosamine mutase